MKICAVVVARKGSVRIPNKHNQKIGDETLIERKIKQLSVTLPKSDIFVGSDDEELQELCEKFSVNFIKRQRKYCDEVSNTPNAMVIDMLNKIELIEKYSHVLWAHPTNPFVSKPEYQAAINNLVCHVDCDSVYSASKLVGFFVDNKGEAINFNFNNTTHKTAREIEPVYSANGGIFVRDFPSMKRDGKFFGARPRMLSMNPIVGWDIDEPWQLELARKIHESNTSFS